ncbi:MAG: response regulator [Rhodomicrobiaceae bacterium]
MKPSITISDGGSPLSGACILIVEDDAFQALEISASLQEQGARILGPASTLDDARQLFAENVCDAVILDLRVGNRNATSFAEALVQHGTPFIIQTGYPDSVFSRLEWAGCRRLTKPVDLAEMTGFVIELLQWRSGLRT